VINPIQQAQIIVDKTTSYNFNTNNVIEVKFTKHLTGTVTLGYTKSGSLRSEYYPSNVSQGRNESGKAIKTTNESERFLNENMLSYDNKWGKHKLGVIVGTTLDRTTSRMLKVENHNFDLENLKDDGIGKGTEPQIPVSTCVQTSLASFYGRVTYDYADRYLFKATFRADGASNFSKNHKWGYFPSAAFAWRINQEEWLKHVKVISNMKIRVGWGESGKRAITSYATLANMGTGVYTSDGESLDIIAYRQSLPNDNLKWETTSEVNIGYDMGFMNSRFTFSIDLYRKVTRDLLYNVPLATYSGFSSQIQNLGKIQNQGVEFSFFANIIKKKNVNWTFDFNISRNQSKVIEIGDRGWEINSTGVGGGSYYIQEGLPLANWFGYQTDGIWQSQKELDDAFASYKEHVAAGIGPQPGDIAESYYTYLKPGYRKIKDQPNAEGKYDGIINADDRVILGQGEPLLTGGFATSFRYKWLTLNVGFTYNIGNKIYNQTRRYLETDNLNNNQLAATAGGWCPTLWYYDADAPDHRGQLFCEGNYSNEYERTQGQVSDSTIYDIYIEDGSFLRLNDVTLIFDFPKQWLQKIKMKALSVFVTGKNLYVCTKYTGYDPEVNMSTGDARFLCPGLDKWAYPKSRVISGGIKVTF
ncbi:MAG: SusC/RagA family TonB-linked outer membrane protein, partial [Candidatus Cryptobacteroides sp.]